MPRSPILMLLVFAITLFTSATLLFMVEPMIGKMITPLLGGTPAVWNTCMVFFQAVLLAGYAYAHFSTTWLGARKQAVLHLALLVLPFLFLPVAVNPDIIKAGENPILGLLLLLSLTVGVPMFVVSASAPLLQKWFANTSHPSARDPYFLYGASNLGSMLALIAYPTVVERYLRLGQQSFDWTIGYGILAALTALCAVFLWLSPPNTEISSDDEAKAAKASHKSGGRSSEAIKPSKHGIRGGDHFPPPPASEIEISTTLKGDVTWLRVLRWVVLAFVPSSLMLGATTYITTDIAAIPLLWVTPLALYLLTFIIVFSHVPSWLQWLILVIEGVVIGVVAGFLLWDVFAARPLFQLVVRTLIVLGVGAGVYVAWWGWKYRSTDMLHRAKVLVMPLLVLGVLFFMLFEGKVLPIGGRLALHLAMLFVVSMVCHGELARDRPAAKYLTGYFLWMSVGGVLGGLFNGLLAPVIFTGIVEYELVMVLACYLAPPLGPENESSWGRSFDMILALMFASLGLLLIVLRLRDKDLPFAYLKDSPWPWELAALIVGIVLCSAAALRARENKPDRWLDLILPLCLGVLLIGLAWGLRSNALWPRVAKIAVSINQPTSYLIGMLVYGVPIVLCYVFVERSVRFALGVGMVLLASAFCSIFDDRVVHQERSFFGVLKIEEEEDRFNNIPFVFRRLVHGTTLHGMQFVSPESRRDEPVTYYHHTGPMGDMMFVYNGKDTPPDKINMAVIGLGTGSMACFARPGQHLTFYDIDPIVKRLSFDKGEGPYPYFTFVQDAIERGAKVDLVMGDARLTMQRQQLKDSEKYGFILVDAFSSDAIPIHLITQEALNVYLSKLTEDGVICFHISNRYLDLEPVLYNLAQAQNPKLWAVVKSDGKETDPNSTALLGKTSSTWVVLSRSKESLNKLRELNSWEEKRAAIQEALVPLSLWPDNGTGMGGHSIFLWNLLDEELCRRRSEWEELEPRKGWPDLEGVGVWTDDYSNLFSVFSWR
ncbi:MAG TPA: hypothetical protein VE999_11085 [Gemmataceae bacterium]|nr:hypothetical protein [Gemmataceae bacterium]